MPTPKAGYYLNSTRIPSFSTVTNKNIEGLLIWAYGLGKADGLAGKRDAQFRDERSALDVGTAAHAMVDARIKHGLVDVETVPEFASLSTNEMRDQARSSFLGFEAWAKRFKFRVIQTETPLTSSKYRYGGTPDCIAEIDEDKKLILLDWKTSSSIREEYLVQLAAYKNLWDENNPERPIAECHLLRFSKENGDFAHHHFPNLDEAWRKFVLLREIYDIDKQLKKRAA